MAKEEKSIEDSYNKLKAKYGLPSFTEMNKEFEVELIEHDSFLLREILRNMYDKIDKLTKLLEEILQPESHIAGLFESGHITEDQKKKWYGLYRQLMLLNRKGIATFMLNDEKKEAENIMLVWKAWHDIKDDIIELGETLATAWEQEDTDLDNEQQGYLG